MSRKITKEILKELCEQFDTLTYGSTGMKAPCFCGHNDHITREFSDDVLVDFKRTCRNIIAMIEDSGQVLTLEKQVKSLQEAFKSQAIRIEILNGILNLDPDPSPESEAALALIQRAHMELIQETNMKFAHVVFIYCDEEERIRDIKWVKQIDGFKVNRADVNSQSDKAEDKPKR